MVRTEEEVQVTLAQALKGTVEGILVTSSLSLNIPGFILEVHPIGRSLPCLVEHFW
jgi:hypothetical protein